MIASFWSSTNKLFAGLVRRLTQKRRKMPSLLVNLSSKPITNQKEPESPEFARTVKILISNLSSMVSIQLLSSTTEVNSWIPLPVLTNKWIKLPMKRERTLMLSWPNLVMELQLLKFISVRMIKTSNFTSQNMDISSKVMFILLIFKVQNIDIWFNGSDQDFHLTKSHVWDSIWIFWPVENSDQMSGLEFLSNKVTRMILFWLSSQLVSFVTMVNIKA